MLSTSTRVAHLQDTELSNVDVPMSKTDITRPYEPYIVVERQIVNNYTNHSIIIVTGMVNWKFRIP